VSFFNGLRILVTAILRTFPLMKDVFAITAFTLALLGLLGMQLFSGNLRQRCMYVTVVALLLHYGILINTTITLITIIAITTTTSTTTNTITVAITITTHNRYMDAITGNWTVDEDVNHFCNIAVNVTEVLQKTSLQGTKVLVKLVSPTPSSPTPSSPSPSSPLGFTAQQACCACGGGSEPKSSTETCVPTEGW
jgi:hypothetical protein